MTGHDKRQDHGAGDFGALVGWDHQNLGDRVMVCLQSTRDTADAAGRSIDEFRYLMTKNQAAVLANFLFSISGRLPPAPRRRRWFG